MVFSEKENSKPSLYSLSAATVRVLDDEEDIHHLRATVVTDLANRKALQCFLGFRFSGLNLGSAQWAEEMVFSENTPGCLDS